MAAQASGAATRLYRRGDGRDVSYAEAARRCRSDEEPERPSTPRREACPADGAAGCAGDGLSAPSVALRAGRRATAHDARRRPRGPAGARTIVRRTRRRGCTGGRPQLTRARLTRTGRKHAWSADRRRLDDARRRSARAAGQRRPTAVERSVVPGRSRSARLRRAGGSRARVSGRRVRRLGRVRAGTRRSATPRPADGRPAAHHHGSRAPGVRKRPSVHGDIGGLREPRPRRRSSAVFTRPR